MARYVAVRLKALLLALLLVSGQAFAAADGLFHHDGTSDPYQSHIERPSGCQSHAERCPLDVLLALGAVQRVPAGATPVVAVALVAADLPAVPALRPTAPPLVSHRSRAPPLAA